MSPPILHSRWYEEKSWIYFYSMESLAGVGVAHQVEISAQQPGPATAPLQAGVAADHWSPVRRGWSSAWPQQPPSPGADPPWWRPVWRLCRAPPAAQRPGSHTQQRPGPRKNSSPVSSQVNTRQIPWIDECCSDCREAVFVIIQFTYCSRHLWKLLFQ